MSDRAGGLGRRGQPGPGHGLGPCDVSACLSPGSDSQSEVNSELIQVHYNSSQSESESSPQSIIYFFFWQAATAAAGRGQPASARR